MNCSWIYFQVLSGVLIESIQNIFHIICCNVITSIDHTICENCKGGEKGFLFTSKWTHSLAHSRVNKTSLEEAPLSAMGSKTLQELILFFKLINTASRIKLQEETSIVELWDMPVKAQLW